MLETLHRNHKDLNDPCFQKKSISEKANISPMMAIRYLPIRCIIYIACNVATWLTEETRRKAAERERRG